MSTQTLIRTSINPPDKLKAMRQWMLWQDELVGDKLNKTPYSPNLLGEFGSSIDPDTWADFESVHRTYLDYGYAGIAFVMTPQDSIVGIDLDGCFDETGNPQQWAQDILDRFSTTYAEISPSGNGIKIFTEGYVKSAFEKSFGDHVGIEGYCKDRFFTVTGNLYGAHPREITTCQTSLDWLWDTHGRGNTPDEESFAGFRLPKLPRDLIIREGSRSNVMNRLCYALAYVFQCNEELVYNCLVNAVKHMKGKEDFSESKLRQIVKNACRASWKNQKSAAEQLVRENVVQLFCPQLTIEEEVAIPVNGKNATWDIGNHIVARMVKHQSTDPTIFNSNNQLKQVVRGQDGLTIIECTDHDINRRMSQATNFTKDGMEPCESPLKWATAITQTLDCIQMFPALSSITEAPLFDLESGELQTEIGYNESKKAYYYSPHPVDLNIPENPTKAQVNEAVKFIRSEVLKGFNFLGNTSSEAGAIAMILTALLRSSFEEPTPLFAIDAAEAESGKSCLSQMPSWISTGRDLAFSVYAPNPEEFEKRLSSYLLGKPGAIIAFDNLTATLNSAEFCQILTSKTYQPRLLGGNKVPVLKNTNTWIANGNNLKLGEDLMRRTIHIRIGFHTAINHDPQEWIRENRDTVLSAFYTLARYWFRSGCPKPSFKLGSFERWSAVVGGIMQCAGIEGLMNSEDRATSRAILDMQGDEIGEFLRSLYSVIGDHVFTTGNLLTRLLVDSSFQQVCIRLPKNPREYNVTTLGRVLHGWCDKTRDNLTLVRARSENIRGYKLVKKA